jgi:hypothetical protein
MIVEKQMECRLAGETEVLGENLPQRHFCPSQTFRRKLLPPSLRYKKIPALIHYHQQAEVYIFSPGYDCSPYQYHNKYI